MEGEFDGHVVVFSPGGGDVDRIASVALVLFAGWPGVQSIYIVG